MSHIGSSWSNAVFFRFTSLSCYDVTAPYYIYVWCSWGCGVGVWWGRLGVCGSAVVPAYVVSGWIWSCRVWNTTELVA